MYSLDPTPIEICTDLAKRHKSLRKSIKLTQSEMAERSGVSLGSLKRFENTGQISLLSLLKLAKLMNRLEDFNKVFKPGEDLSKIEKLFTNNND
ncbi:MAG: helix-turn-helix transcriptional regulator [Marinilabiliaceae bacterium]|jgi:transcriptional regulator with XRE-family HTH domain|nr:helix-turn-helix transcriptional regulator [Marinilabiliaceae bacterium]